MWVLARPTVSWDCSPSKTRKVVCVCVCVCVSQALEPKGNFPCLIFACNDSITSLRLPAPLERFIVVGFCESNVWLHDRLSPSNRIYSVSVQHRGLDTWSSAIHVRCFSVYLLTATETCTCEVEQRVHIEIHLQLFKKMLLIFIH